MSLSLYLKGLWDFLKKVFGCFLNEIKGKNKKFLFFLLAVK